MKYDKKRNFVDLRKLAIKIGDKLSHDDYKSPIMDCSSIMDVYKSTDGRYFLHRLRCRDRFCPICNHVKSTILSTFLNSQYDLMKVDHNFISLTLTCRNVPLSELKSTQVSLYRAFRNMQANYRYRLCKETAGLRTYECTYNVDDNTFHPHFHALLAFPKSFPLDLISKYDFGADFASFLPDSLTSFGTPVLGFGSHYTTDYGSLKSVVWDCQEYDPNKSTFFEFTKYISKFTSLVDTLSDDDFRAFYQINKGVQTHSMYGAWRGYLKNMPDEYDNSVYVDKQIIQNANLVFVGSIFTTRTALKHGFKPAACIRSYFNTGPFNSLLLDDSFRQFMRDNICAY